MAGYERLIAELESIADMVQAKDRTAAKWLDVVTNEVEAVSRKRSRKAAETPEVPDWEAADEPGHQDSFEAKDYHKFPVGKDSVSKLLGRPSAADSKPDFADEGKIKIQASKAASVWPFTDLTPEGLKLLATSGQWREVARAARVAAAVLASDDVPDAEGDMGDPTDTYSTSGLPETGGDASVDEDQEGEDLEFFGTQDAGTLHMPSANTGPKKSLDPDTMMDKGRDLVTARSILEAAAGRRAAEVSVQSPESMGMESDVERDQALGGFGKGSSDTGPDPLNTVAPITGSRKALKIRIPEAVAAEDRYLWRKAAQRIATAKSIKVAGRVNYPAINAEYARLKKSRDQARAIFHGAKVR